MPHENGDPVEGDPDEDRQEAWVRSILASLPKSGRGLLEQSVEPVSTSSNQAVKLYRKSRQRKAKEKGTPGSGHAVRGWVYLFRADNPAGMYKIGYSTDPVRRLEAVQAACPAPLVFEWAIPCWGNDGTELKLHRRFAEQRVHGEWFMLSKEDVKWIKELPGGFPVRV
jgi:hypothetical protein